MNDRELGRLSARYEMLRLGEKPSTADVTDHLDFLAGYREGVAQTERMLHTPIPHVQLYRAWRVARAYGHLWATVIPVQSSVPLKTLLAPSPPLRFWTPGLIREFVYSLRIEDASTDRFPKLKPVDHDTIVMPVFLGNLQNDPTIFHRTSGKHLCYWVDATGTIMVQVYSVNDVTEPKCVLVVEFDSESNIPRWNTTSRSYTVDDVRQLKTVYSALGWNVHLQTIYRGASDYSSQLQLL